RNPSRSLVNGIAAAGNGRAEFIKDGQDLENVMGRHLSRALQPAVNNAKVSFNGLTNLQQTPTALPPVFKGDRQLVFATFELSTKDNLEDEDINEPPYVELQAGRFKTKIPLVIPASKKVNETSTLSKLAARELIRELEASKPPSVKPSPYWTLPAAKDTSVEERITAISLQYGVMSKYVSLVALELRPNSSKTENTDSMELVEVPIQSVRPSAGGFAGYPGGAGGNSGAQQSSSNLMWPIMYAQSQGTPGRAPSGTGASGGNDYSAMMQMMMQQGAQGGSSAGDSRPSASASESAMPQQPAAVDCGKTPSALSCVLKLQQWDGSWTLTEELVNACTKGKSLADVKAAGKSLDEEALATALAVTYLEERFTGQRDTWRAIADKAIDFLAGMWQSKEKVALDVKSRLLALVKGK
ncbi:hypothetical protein BV898_15733, partial [Hypsibius exemplaris]